MLVQVTYKSLIVPAPQPTADEAASIVEIGMAPAGVATWSGSPHREKVTISPLADVPAPLDSTASTGSDRHGPRQRGRGRPAPPGAAPAMLFTVCPFTLERLPMINRPEGVTFPSAEARPTLAVMARKCESAGCTEIQRPASVGPSAVGSPK